MRLLMFPQWDKLSALLRTMARQSAADYCQRNIVRLEPKVTWSPDLSEDVTPRTYTIYGKATLSNDEEWNVVTDENKSAMRFFYVTVDLK